MTDSTDDIFEATSYFQKLYPCLKRAEGTYQKPRVDKLLVVLKGFKASQAERVLIDRFGSL
jgi:hypothetical protein